MNGSIKVFSKSGNVVNSYDYDPSERVDVIGITAHELLSGCVVRSFDDADYLSNFREYEIVSDSGVDWISIKLVEHNRVACRHALPANSFKCFEGMC